MALSACITDAIIEFGVNQFIDATSGGRIDGIGTLAHHKQ
jgi:hypothetical protein